MIQKNIPTVFVIFGATGDLMTKKIVPALFNLFQKERLPLLFRIIGIARRSLSTEQFHTHILHILREHRLDSNKKQVQRFLNFFSYQGGTFEAKETYDVLSKTLGRTDTEWKVCSNKLFYLAVPPEYYEGIFKHLSSSGLTIPCGPDEGWTRVLVEKPFGKDAKTAEKLDLLLAKLFKEEQIYRIDHYLAKEMLQNILSFRFSNNLLEQSWNNKFIEKIEIQLLEEIGVEKRGLFYDGLGALVDVGQNHLLQMLALVTMEHPQSLSADVVRTKRAGLLDMLRCFSEKEIKTLTRRAQYEGYKRIAGVKANSQTETYFRVTAFLDSPRWQGVPVMLESGKRIGKSSKEIIVTFKHVTPCLCPPGKHYTNKVIFSIEPQEGIKIYFLAKKPGLGSQVEIQERSFNFIYRKHSKKTQYVEEYEKLLLDCIEGNQLLFLSTEEVRAMWGFIDPIVSSWHKGSVPLQYYRPDTDEIVRKIQETRNKIHTLRKEIGIIGLGKMGANIARQLIEKDWRVTGFNRTKKVVDELKNEGVVPSYSLEELAKKLRSPRVIWIMVPAGKAVDEMITEITPFLQKGDIIVDAGNSLYKDAVRRADLLKNKGIGFVDVGVSGGPSGARYGVSLMVGGDKETFEYLLPLLTEVSVSEGVQFFEGMGAGHFVKMVHNGIEYGMMQAIAEGFEILKKSKYKLDLNRVAEVYSHGTVIESRLIDWLRDGLKIYGSEMDKVAGKVPRGGEADWTVQTAKEEKVKTRIIEEAVKYRQYTEKHPSYQGKILNLIRNMFGGHSITGKLWDRNYMMQNLKRRSFT